MLENNVDTKRQRIQFTSMLPQQLQQQQVAMQAQGVDPELLKQNIQDSYVANRVSETTDDPKGMLYTALLAIPTWFGIAKGMDYFAQKTRNNYEDTIYNKVGQFGDDITSRVKSSSFGKSSFANSLVNGYKNFKKFVKEGIVDRFKITRAFAYTPSRPENHMVLTQADGMIGFLGTDFPQVAESFLRPTENVVDLVCYGAEKTDIDKFKTLLSKAKTKEERALILQKAEFECLSKYSRGTQLTGSALTDAIDDFAKLDAKSRAAKLEDMKAFEWGFKDFNDLKDFKENIHKNPERILEASSQANKKMFSRAYPTKNGFIDWFKHKLLNRDVYSSEFTNKMAASITDSDIASRPELARALQNANLTNKIPKSALGKAMNKYMNVILEGATNRVAGGKFVALMQAAYFADVLYKTFKADGASEKVKTFAERFTEMIAFFACIPLAIKLMHKVGGLQYAGMTKEQVETYRKHLKLHNDKAMAGGFADKKAWKASRDALRQELNAGVKNPITKLFKRIGRIVTVGLEQIRPYDKKDIADIAKDGTKTYRKGIMSKLRDLFRHPKFGMKQMMGYPMRIGLGMMVILPFLGKIAVKGSHLIFGKPKNSLLDEGKEKPQQNPSQNQQTALPPQLNNTQNNQANVNQQIPQNQQSQGGNLLDKYRTTQNKTTPQDVPAPKTQEPVRTYIPSPVGVKITNTNEDPTAANDALKRADFAEQEALKALKMN